MGKNSADITVLDCLKLAGLLIGCVSMFVALLAGPIVAVMAAVKWLFL